MHTFQPGILITHFLYHQLTFVFYFLDFGKKFYFSSRDVTSGKSWKLYPAQTLQPVRFYSDEGLYELQKELISPNLLGNKVDAIL